MPARDVIVIGGSAGSVMAMQQLAARLPRDLPAAVLVVVHTAPESPGVLAQVVDRAGPLAAVHPGDGAPIEHGRILVAPPDRHLVVEGDHVRVTRGPRENRFRPAVDVLFRSAAGSHGPRVAGVILSGLLTDGTHGLLAVKRHGGIAIVQDASEAMFDSMPRSAAAEVDVDHILPVAEIATLLVRLARAEGARDDAIGVDEPGDRKGSVAGAAGNGDEREVGRPAAYACPDCGGALWELAEPEPLRFRCRIGHGFTADGLVAAQDARLEDALWTALRALEEAAALRRRMAERVGAEGLHAIARQYEIRAEEAEARAATIREVVEDDGPRAAELAKRPDMREKGLRRERSPAPRRSEG